MFNGFPQFPLFLPPSLATWSGFSGHKIPAVFSLIASPKLFPVSSYLVLRSVTHLYSLNSFQCWLSDLKGAHLSSIRTKSQVVTPILTRIRESRPRPSKSEYDLGAPAPCCDGEDKMIDGELHWVALVVFIGLFLLVTVLGFVAARWRIRGCVRSGRQSLPSKRGSLSLDAASRPDAAVRIAGTRFCVCPLHVPALGDRGP